MAMHLKALVEFSEETGFPVVPMSIDTALIHEFITSHVVPLKSIMATGDGDGSLMW